MISGTFLGALIKRFRRDQKGAVALIFTIALLPLLALLGAAVDYTGAQRLRSQLNAAADAAALGAVAATGRISTPPEAQVRADAAFRANAALDVSIASISRVSATVTDTATERTALVSYSAIYRPSFMKILGVDQLAIEGEARVTGPMSPYVDFYMLLDNTPSMGLGATLADISRLENNTPDRCAFACHLRNTPNDYYALARSLNVNLRIDVLRTATQRLMDTAMESRLRGDQYRVAIHTFGATGETMGLTTVSSLTSDLNLARSRAGTINLMELAYWGYAGYAQTHFDQIFNQIGGAIPNGGDGSSAVAPQKLLFFVSDGVNNAAKSTCARPTMGSQDPVTGYTYTRCVEPINPQLCAGLKARGVKIAVLYTTYYELPSNAFYVSAVQPFQPTIASNMQQCASPGLYFEVSPSQGIAEAMSALFLKAIASVKLTK
jgi:Flp pilus assembly protein TadG